MLSARSGNMAGDLFSNSRGARDASVGLSNRLGTTFFQYWKTHVENRKYLRYKLRGWKILVRGVEQIENTWDSHTTVRSIFLVFSICSTLFCRM